MSGAVSQLVVSPIRATKLTVIGKTVTVVSVHGGPARVTYANVGMPGPMGPSGGAGNTYVHNQIAPSASWTINHDLGYFPNVTVIDDDGAEIFGGNPQHLDNMTTVLTFGLAISGRAYLS